MLITPRPHNIAQSITIQYNMLLSRLHLDILERLGHLHLESMAGSSFSTDLPSWIWCVLVVRQLLRDLQSYARCNSPYQEAVGFDHENPFKTSH